MKDLKSQPFSAYSPPPWPQPSFEFKSFLWRRIGDGSFFPRAMFFFWFRCVFDAETHATKTKCFVFLHIGLKTVFHRLFFWYLLYEI